jgi:hypothetical protein
MDSIVDTSVYCLPADILGEGADRVVGTVRDRAGLPGVTVAACYHASRDILPHNPAYRVASLAPGAFYAVDPSAYPGPLRPAVDPADTSAALTWYRAQLAPGAPLSVVLRPGPPDTTTPASLREKPS